eukprot:TRINITY_DN3284_c0_g2_i2.p1 TRINITY_DN3284_c0_g2~~TRINITY_DN3284_c0_g2_i2.p1  ORF type:complete len:215 (+),score=68.74 TRINITY_DN3284_c0_g2_i2:82-726(+)
MIGGTMRSGNPKKEGQKHQNVYKFRPNKNSRKSRALVSTPLDKLCKRCYEILKWKLDYHKYKPLKEPGKCIKCESKTVVKAYRMFCDNCAAKNKICSKCGNKTEEFHHVGTKMSKDERVEKVEEILATLKEREKRSIMRGILKGEIAYNTEKGLVYTGKDSKALKLRKKKEEEEEFDMSDGSMEDQFDDEDEDKKESNKGKSKEDEDWEDMPES